MTARIDGDNGTAMTHARAAFEFERQAADLIASDASSEPTRSILHRSAATLALDCGEPLQAERLALQGLSGKPPAEVAEELRNLLERVRAGNRVESFFVVEPRVEADVKLDALRTTYFGQCAEFLRNAELFDIDPRPVPHVHIPHENLARTWNAAFWLFTVLGALGTFASTATVESLHPILIAVIGFVGFLLLEFMIVLFMQIATDEKGFANLLYRYTLPWMVLAMVSLAILLLARFPNSVPLAAQMFTYAWWGLEISLAFLGGVALVALKRFGWSRRLTRRIQDLEYKMARVRQRETLDSGEILLRETSRQH